MVFLVILACFFIFVFFYAKSINAQHRDFQNYYDQSRRAYVAKDYLGCIGAARKGLQFKPANADAYNMISMAYLGLRAWDKAEDAAQRALKLAPDFEAARRNLYFAKTGEKLELGKVFFKRGKYAEAIKLCNDVLRINPGSVNAYIVLSRVYRAWGNKKGAEEAAEKALEIASRSQRVYANFDFVRDALGWDK